MLIIGLLMLGAAAIMLIAARPKDRIVVPWLRGEFRQQIYGFAVVLLLSTGLFLSIAAWMGP